MHWISIIYNYKVKQQKAFGEIKYLSRSQFTSMQVVNSG